MIAVGIPSFNEADNIGYLVKAIDLAALALDKPIVIINADNSSEDGTADVFQAVCTTSQKVSLTTAEKGKGRNIKCIIDYITENNIDYCFFVDGDVISLESHWLKKHIVEAERGTDYVVPNYSRKMQEGNATNHFFFPSLNSLSKGRAPYQPIAGDIGISSRFAQHLKGLPWHRSTLGYGVDIFMTMHALFDGFKVVEISLDSKIHKPSYGKMLTIFEEGATSYFEARKRMKIYRNVNFTREENKPLTLLQGNPIPTKDLEERAKYAKVLLAENANASIFTWLPLHNVGNIGLDAETWAKVLVEHEKYNNYIDTFEITKSLMPFYLLRVTKYLREVTTPTKAEEELAYQASLIAGLYTQAGL